MRNRLALLISFGAASLFTACSGDLSGTLSVRTHSGNVKPAADVEIVLVRATEQFESEWKKAIAAFEIASNQALTAYDQDEARNLFRSHAVKLIAWGKPKTARTDVNGHYEMKGIRPGKYYHFVHYRVFDNEVYEMVSVEITAGSQTIADFSNSSAGWPIDDKIRSLRHAVAYCEAKANSGCAPPRCRFKASVVDDKGTVSMSWTGEEGRLSFETCLAEATETLSGWK